MTSFTSKAEKLDSGICLISLSGYLDAHTASNLEDVIKLAIDEGCVKIVVAFADLEYISSAGLGVFMVFIEAIRKRGGDIKLAAMTDRVFSVFDLLGFPILFQIFPTINEAVEAFPSEA